MPKIAVMKCLNVVYDSYETHYFNVQDSDWVEISDSDLKLLQKHLKDPYRLIEFCPKVDVDKFIAEAQAKEVKELERQKQRENAENARKSMAAEKRKEKEKQKLLKMLKANPMVLGEFNYAYLNNLNPNFLKEVKFKGQDPQ